MKIKSIANVICFISLSSIENQQLGLPRSDTNQPVQSQKQARSLKFLGAKTKALISCASIAQLICTFVFVYACCWFSHVVALMVVDGKYVVKKC